MKHQSKQIPEFKTLEEEAEFWDTHSPLEYGVGEWKPLEVRVPQDVPVTVRLRAGQKAQWAELAKQYHMGPSTLARAVMEVLLENPGQLRLLLASRLAGGEAYTQLPPEVKQAIESAKAASAVREGAGEYVVVSSEQFKQAVATSLKTLAEGLGLKLNGEADKHS